MGFRINTNISALNSHANATSNNRALDNSLSRLSSGLRINTAADDASGMAIADSLRAQSSGLGQAISNANDAIGMIQTADKAMDEQIKILETIRTKATQAAQDGQTTESRTALQKDITRLIENLDNIATQTSYNGQSLLAGAFSNKEFQVGAYSNQTIKASIGATGSDKIGLVHAETDRISAAASIAATFTVGTTTVTLESVTISTGAGTGIGALADVINKNSGLIGGVRASWTNEMQTTGAVAAGDITSLAINGIKIGIVSGVKANDSDGRLVNAINAVKEQTGVEAFTDKSGKMHLRSLDGRGIKLSGGGIAAGISASSSSYGRLTLTRLDSRDIKVSGAGLTFSNAKTTTQRLKDVVGDFNANVASAVGAHVVSTVTDKLGVGVTSLKGAMLVMDIAESAQKLLDSIRSDLGSAQNQLTSTINNISVTQVNVKSAESNIRDVDFASESATFSKHNILAQAGSYAMAQANSVQQNVLKLLQ